MEARLHEDTARRGFLKHACLGASMGLGALVAGCSGPAAPGAEAGGRKRLRAVMSNGGLTGSWCKRGHDAAKLWGDMLDVDVQWLDGEFDPQKQRDKVEMIVDSDIDFFCVQSLQTGALADPAKRLAKRNIPVISMDTLLVEEPKLREAGVWIHISANHVDMAEKSTRYLVEKIKGRGSVIHIGGSSAHSGARDRDVGFRKIVDQYPDVKVLGGGVRWCDWKTEKARDTFEALLQLSKGPVAGAFFHNDDMALACVPALKGTIHEKMIVTSVDGQAEGLGGIRDGRIAATAVNPTSTLHMTSVVIGQFIARNKEKLNDVPLHISLPSPLVSKEAGNLDAMFYMSDPKHCLV